MGLASVAGCRDDASLLQLQWPKKATAITGVSGPMMNLFLALVMNRACTKQTRAVVNDTHSMMLMVSGH